VSNVRVLISEANPGEGDAIREALAQAGDIEIVAYAQDGLEAAQLSYRLRPDVAILWEDLGGLSGLETCELIARTAPEVASILVARGELEQVRQMAMMAGARAVVPAGGVDRLADIIHQLVKLRHDLPESAIEAVTEPEKAPLVVMVVGARGGCGKTTIAANLAVALSRKHGEKVALVEAPPQFGDTAVMFDLQPAASATQLLLAENIDRDFVASSLVKHESNVEYLPGISDKATEELNNLGNITAGEASRMLAILKRIYSTVVLDCSFHFWPVSGYIARRSHIVILVSTAEDLAGVRNAASLTEVLMQCGVTRDRLLPVVNKVTRGGVLSPDDVAKAAGWENYYTVPLDTANCIAAFNEGQPLLMRSPSSPAAAAITRLAEEVFKRGRSIAGKGVTGV